MEQLRKSPFKPDRIEGNPSAYGIRPEEVKTCTTALFNSRSLLISGERGIGKSSLAIQLSNLYAGDLTLLQRCGLGTQFPKYLCGYTICSAEMTLADLATDILHNLEQQYLLLTSFHTKSTKVELKLDLGWFTARIDSEITVRRPATIVADFVGGIAATVTSAKLLGLKGVNVIIDEVDELNASVNAGRFIKMLHERLQNQGIRDEVTFTFTGHTGVFERLYTEDNSSERPFVHVPIKTLSSDEAANVLNFAADNAIQAFAIEPEAQEMILGLATGYPYAIHLIGDSAFQKMHEPTRMTRGNVLSGLLALLQSDKAEKYVGHLSKLDDMPRILLMSMSLYITTALPAQIPKDWVVSNLLPGVASESVEEGIEYLIQKKFLYAGPDCNWYGFCDELFRVFLSHYVLTHREKEEELIAKRRSRMEKLIDKQREHEMKRYYNDFRTSITDASMLNYTLEILNMSDFIDMPDIEHLHRREKLAYRDVIE
jgi:hypothetical protein